MLLSQKEKVMEVLEVREGYKIIVKYNAVRYDYSFAINLKGTRFHKDSPTEGIIDHCPSEEEIQKAVELGIKKGVIYEDFEKYKISVKVEKFVARKVRKIITTIEEKITFEKETEEVE